MIERGLQLAAEMRILYLVSVGVAFGLARTGPVCLRPIFFCTPTVFSYTHILGYHFVPTISNSQKMMHV